MNGPGAFIPPWFPQVQTDMSEKAFLNMLSVLRMYWAIHHRHPISEFDIEEWWARNKIVAPIFLLHNDVERMPQELIEKTFQDYLSFNQRFGRLPKGPWEVIVDDAVRNGRSFVISQ
jgi:hypothetical protein